MKFLGIIPARGGSEGVPSKNIRLLAGKPLIIWSIESAMRSNKLGRLVVSTDDKKIKSMAHAAGAETPFLRPEHLATASLGIEPVLKHAYEYYRDNLGYDADALVLLLPTSPLRQSDHIDQALKIFEETGADSVVSVNEVPANHTPFWTLVRQQDNRVTLWGGINLDQILTRRQDFPQKCYARNDIIYVLKPTNLYRNKISLYGDHVELYEIPHAQRYELDINTPDEWEEAELRLTRLKEKGWI